MLLAPIAVPPRVPPPTLRRRRRASSSGLPAALALAVALVAATLAVDMVVTLARPPARHPAVINVGASPAPTNQPAADGAQLVVAGLDPSACWAYRPTGAANGRTVFLDAGHGGPDPGGSGELNDGTPVVEKVATLAVAGYLSQRLRAQGYRVVLSRTGDTAVTQLTDADLDSGSMRGSALHRDLLARIACANASAADALVAIHFNAFDDSSATGAETFLDPAVQAFWVRDEDVVSHQLAARAELGRELPPSLPVVLRQRVLDRHDRELVQQPAPERRQVRGRQLLAF